MDDIINEAQDSQFRLELTPGSTLEYVQNLTFLDEVQDRIEVLDDQSSYVVQMYELIHQYKVPTPPEDQAFFRVSCWV